MKPHRVVPFDPIPLADAAQIVNDNVAAIRGTLRASGSVDGHFTRPDGRRQTYHLEGVLFYLAPRSVRFDLKSFGETQLLFGSNLAGYWFFNGRDDSYLCGRHGEVSDLPEDMPARPDQIVDALGLTPIPVDDLGRSSAPRTRITQRVSEESQQLMFLVNDPEGRVLIEKEYWLDRFAPRLVRRVIFRDADGAVDMDSSLDDYRRLSADGPLLAHRMVADWPKQDAHMRFEVRKWTSLPEIGSDAIQFKTPGPCAHDGR